jgi:hypothetical protein
MESTMKKRDAIKQIQANEAAIAVKHAEKIRELEAKMDLENRESNYNRARSITVGTSFGGTSEIMMRTDGGRHLWCVMQPVEVIELIHQLAANVGCNAQITPRKDFASWRDWRVSEAEKKHLNGHPPFVNDMAMFQQLGASGHDDIHAQRVMDAIAKVKTYANENDDTEIPMQGGSKLNGAPSLMVGEDQLVHNKLGLVDDEIVYMAGGNGGKDTGMENLNETMAAKKSADR